VNELLIVSRHILSQSLISFFFLLGCKYNLGGHKVILHPIFVTKVEDTFKAFRVSNLTAKVGAYLGCF